MKPVAVTLAAESQVALELTTGAPFVEATVTKKLLLAADTVFWVGDTVSVCTLCVTAKAFVTVPDLTVTVPSLAAPVVLFDAVKVNSLPFLSQVIQSGVVITVQAAPEVELMMFVLEPPAAGNVRVVFSIEIALAAWVTVTVLEMPAVETVRVPVRWVPLLDV